MGSRLRVILVVVGLGVLLTLTALGPPARNPVQSPSPDSSAYVDSGNHFQLVPPPGWKVQGPVPGRQFAVAFLGPQQDGFRANINVATQLLDDDLTSYREFFLTHIREKRGTVISDEEVQLTQGPGRQIIWKRPAQGLEVQFNTTFFLTGGTLYLFTGTSLVSQWDEVAGLFHTSALTLRSAP